METFRGLRKVVSQKASSFPQILLALLYSSFPFHYPSSSSLFVCSGASSVVENIVLHWSLNRASHPYIPQ